MNKIGSGVQYNAYDIGNNRIKKIPTSFFEKVIRFHNIAKKYKLYLHPLHNIKTCVLASKQTKESAENLLNNMASIDQRLLGNPKINSDYSYEQDKVFIFGEKFNSYDISKQKALIDAYIENILSCFDYGFSDTNFNFMINSGVTEDGEVILIDLGELSWDKEEIRKLVISKNWEKKGSFNKLEDGELKDYLRKELEQRVNIHSFENRWGSKLNKYE